MRSGKLRLVRPFFCRYPSADKLTADGFWPRHDRAFATIAMKLHLLPFGATIALRLYQPTFDVTIVQNLHRLTFDVTIALRLHHPSFDATIAQNLHRLTFDVTIAQNLYLLSFGAAIRQF